VKAHGGRLQVRQGSVQQAREDEEGGVVLVGPDERRHEGSDLSGQRDASLQSNCRGEDCLSENAMAPGAGTQAAPGPEDVESVDHHGGEHGEDQKAAQALLSWLSAIDVGDFVV
jgi:hypothetical protein